MKYLLVMLVVAIARHLAQKRRVHGSSTTSTNPSTALSKPQSMVECTYCGLHLSQTDTVADAQGRLYCSAEHRHLAAQDPNSR